MAVAANETLETIYGLVKQHEASLARVEHTGHRVERDIFGELLAETRVMAHELKSTLEDRRINADAVSVTAGAGSVTPKSLIDERDTVRSAYAAAISEYSADSDVRSCLESHHHIFTGGGQDKLEILCAAIVSDQ